MSNYQRLISYIYAYEGGNKGKNIGFAKLDTRGSQCRIMVNVKRIYIGGNPIGVYLLTGAQEVRIGTLFARNGAGEFRTVINTQNVEGSGHGLEDFFGLTVHDTESAWRCYTTIWEDAVTHAAEVELAEVTSEKKGEILHTEQLSVADEIEAELDREEVEHLGILKIREKETTDGISPEISGRLTETEEKLSSDDVSETEVSEEPAPEMPKKAESQPEEADAAAEPGEAEPAEEAETAEVDAEEGEGAAEGEGGAKAEVAAEAEPEDKEEVPESSIPLPFPREEETKDEKELWEMLRSRYPKILAFDYEDGCEILTIKPQDIGLLPRENWVYGSNSFLLHGYYYYRYLILARLNRPGGRGRYLLGVPGHYVSNEKYMASMFGFSDFVLSKKQPPKDSRFGYWYTDIKLGNG